jgi:hypothetical protein
MRFGGLDTTVMQVVTIHRRFQGGMLLKEVSAIFFDDYQCKEWIRYLAGRNDTSYFARNLMFLSVNNEVKYGRY